MNRFSVIFVGVLILALGACSESGSESTATSTAGKGRSFPALPTSTSESATLEGRMRFWMYEGDGGCFGTITDGTKDLELWVDVDTCGDKDYAENAPATVTVTFNPENQYGSGKMYTIVSFD